MGEPDMLNLIFLKVLSVNDTQSPLDYYITAESHDEVNCCQACGIFKTNALSKYGKRGFMYADIPIHGRRVMIKVIRQRYKCHECGSTFFVQLLDMDDKHNCTKRLVGYIKDKSLVKKFTSLAEETGLNEKTIRNIFHEHIDFLESKYKRVIPRWMGIDEIHLLGSARLVITNIEQRTIVDMLENNRKDTLITYFRNVGIHSAIEYVTMDMHAPYRTVCRELFSTTAKVIVDKYHVVQAVQMAIKATRARRHVIQGKGGLS